MNQQSVRSVVFWRVTAGLLRSYVLAWSAVALFVAGVGAVHAESLAIVHGNLLDVERRKVVADATVMMTDGRIVQVGKSSAVRVPPEAEVVDARGKWILPGLVDAHVHLFQSGGLYTRPDAIDLRRFRPYEEERAWVRDNAGDLLARYVAAGITTVIDIGGPLANYALRDRFNADPRSPTILLTGPLISTRQPAAFAIEDAPILQADTPERAREQVRQQLPYRPDFIKIWYIVRPELPALKTLPIIQATIDEAHEHGLKVAVHATQLDTAKLAVRAGADFLVHGVEDVLVDTEFITLLKEHRVPYIPTLVVSDGYASVLSRNFHPSSRDLELANPQTLGSLSDLNHLVENHGYVLAEGKAPAAEREQIRLRNLKAVHDAGIVVATGTDAGNIGTLHASSYLAEVLKMQAAGLNAWDILRASTIDGAKVLGREREAGSITPGKRADLVVLDRNPLEDVSYLRYVHRVVNRATLFDPQSLIDRSAEALVQQQVNGYNARDIEAFLEPYAEDVQVYIYPGQWQYTGKEAMRTRYRTMFEKTPQLHCEIVERIVMGNVVIDQERVTGRAEGPLQAVAIYTVQNGKISRVEFVR